MSAIPLYQSSLVAQIPLGFMPEELRVRTGDWVARLLPRAEDAKSPAVIWEVRKGRTRLRARTPISVRMRTEGGYVFAENDTLRVFGHGCDTESALQDFSNHVIYFHKYYSSLREDQVIGEGLCLKKAFADMFEQVR